MKKNIKKLALKKQTVHLLGNGEHKALVAGAPTTGGNGTNSFGTRCFVCDLAKPIPIRPGV
ncbi:MAG: hypothetical protein JNM68_07205 [Dinghuibacter sp.]|nr:hypothetical protein [Dinghuibacter sp.]